MTKTLTLPLALVAGLMLTGCPEPIACDASAHASISMTVVDETGAPIPDATATYTVDGGAVQDCEDWGDGSLVCGIEEAGDFEITVDAWGFETATIQQTVGADECHVDGQVLEVELQAIACTEEALPSVLVTVTDSQGADVTTGDVSWNLADEDDLNEPCDWLGSNEWACGYETAGELRIDIENAGPYQPFSQLVTVTEDECHVITESMDAVLQYLPD